MVNIRKLDCGAWIVMEPTDYVRSAAVGVWVRAGSSLERDNVSGVSHFIEHMMFKGTEKRTARQIAEDADRIGGMCNAFTGREATCYYIKTLSSNISQGAEILIDILTGSVFDEQEIERERQVILEEIKMIRDTPDEDVMEIISDLVNSGNAIGNSILGTPESLAGIGRQEMVDYYREQYTCDSMVIAVSGNFDPDQLTQQFEEGLKDMPRTKTLPSPEKKPYRQSVRVNVRDIEQTHICLACPSISLADDRFHAMVLLNSIFGGSMSSRLFQNIREEKGLAYSVASMNVLSGNSGFFNIYAGVAHEKVSEAVEAIHEEMTALHRDGVNEEELAMAREQVKSSFIFGLENITSRMFNLGKNKLLLDRVIDPDETLRTYDAVTAEDIANAAGLLCPSEEFCGAAVTGRDFDLEALIRRES